MFEKLEPVVDSKRFLRRRMCQRSQMQCQGQETSFSNSRFVSTTGGYAKLDSLLKTCFVYVFFFRSRWDYTPIVQTSLDEILWVDNADGET